MNTFKCKFCNEPLTIEENIETEYINVGGRECKPCFVKYHFNTNKIMQKMFLFTPLKNNTFYAIEISFINNTTDIMKWRKIKDKDGTGTTGSANRVVKLDSILDVTPNSIQEKLKTILTFL